MSNYLLITQTGGLVSLAAQNPDVEAVEVATKRLARAGVAGFVASSSGPATVPTDLVLVREFGDPTATFKEARERLANRKRASANTVFRVGNR